MKLLIPALGSIALSLASLSAFASTSADLYGQAANPAAAVRTIVVGPNTRSVNVTRGEIVNLVANGQEVAWDFDGKRSAFALEQIAPSVAEAPTAHVYISDYNIPG